MSLKQREIAAAGNIPEEQEDRAAAGDIKRRAEQEIIAAAGNIKIREELLLWQQLEYK